MGLYDKIQRSGNAPAQGDDLQPQSALNQHSDASAAAREEPLSNAQEGNPEPCAQEECLQPTASEDLVQDSALFGGEAQTALSCSEEPQEASKSAAIEDASNEQPQPQNTEPSEPCQADEAQRDKTNTQVALPDRLTGEIEEIKQILLDHAAHYECQRQALEQQTRLLEQQNQALVKQQQMLASALRENASFQVQVRGEMLRELENYRKLHSGEALIPPLKAIAQLYCDHYSLTQEPCEDLLGKKISYLFDDLIELLEEYEVKMARTEPCGERSLRLSAAKKSLPTDNRALHGKVAYSHNPSFTLGQTVLVREQVDVYVYQEPAPLNPASTGALPQSSSQEGSQPPLPAAEQ